MNLKNALEKSKIVSKDCKYYIDHIDILYMCDRDGLIVPDSYPISMLSFLLYDDFEPVFERVNIIQAAEKWSKFRRRSWPNPIFHFYKTPNAISIIRQAGSPELQIYITTEMLLANDWEEYKK
jgi:hypothetical protein